MKQLDLDLCVVYNSYIYRLLVFLRILVDPYFFVTVVKSCWSKRRFKSRLTDEQGPL